MNREVIERLAIDSAAGELNEDAEALLQFYLDEHPQAKQWAENVRQVYGQTEAALKAKTAHSDVEQIVPKISPISRLMWRTTARWAAVIVLGMLIGFTAGRWETPARTQKIAFQESNRVSIPTKTVSDLKERYAGTFWGDKMLAMLEHPPGRGNTADLRDIRSWDTYRQYMKEKNHE
ncbi:MAG: hypothetical protein JXM79_23165 [Sedimentisphaerales bacterium]|nr:hypothetical protein [Sedimentisphaerales bacterium]